VAAAGEIETNCGIIVEGILNTGAPTFTKIAVGVTDYRTYDELAAQYTKTTGEQGTFVQIPEEVYAKMFGLIGVEVAMQLRFGEKHPNWHAIYPDRVVSMKELGVEDKLIGFEEAMERQKDLIV
jgi:hypothetical protein